MVNQETLSKNDPIFFPGGLSEIGTHLTKKFIFAGYRVIPWTTSREKLVAVQESISEEGGTELVGCVANLVDRNQVETAYESLHLEPGTPVYLLLWSVTSMSLAMRIVIGREIADAYKKKKNIVEATQGIRDIVRADGALDDLPRINTGMLHIVHLLRRDGHLIKDSVVSTLSSSGSDACDPNDLDSYPGPQLYLPIAYPKQSLVLSLQEKAQEAGFQYRNFVAPQVEGTSIVAWFTKLIAKVKEAYPDMVFDMPTIAKMDLVETLFNQFVYVGSREQIENVYIRGLNKVSRTRPPEWNRKYPF